MGNRSQQQRRPMKLENSVFSSNTRESKIQKALDRHSERDKGPDKVQLEKAALQVFDDEKEKKTFLQGRLSFSSL